MITKYKHNKSKRRVSIYEEFCQEMDLFSDNQPYPDWVFDFRENLLTKINSKTLNFCRKLKANNVDFRMVYPVLIFGRWKFADVYIPKHKTVVMVNTMPHPAGWLSARAKFFEDRFKVYEFDGYESIEFINNLIEKLK